MRQFTKLYTVLGLDSDQETITEKDIKTAYRKRSKEVHPDVEGGSEEMQAEVNHAYKILRDPQSRMRYDSIGDSTDTAEATVIPGIELLYEMVEQVLTPEQKEGGLFAALMGKQDTPEVNDFREKDLIGDLQRMLVGGRENVLKQLALHEAQAYKLDNIIERLTFKGGKVDVLGGILKTRRDAHLGSVAKAKEKLEEIKAVNELLKAYTFRYEAPKPEQRVFTRDQIRGMSAEAMFIDDPEEFIRRMYTHTDEPKPENPRYEPQGFDHREVNDQYNRRRPKK